MFTGIVTGLGTITHIEETETGRRLQQYLGANARLVLIEKAGHTVNGEKAGKFNRAALDFLKEPKEKKKKKRNRHTCSEVDYSNCPLLWPALPVPVSTNTL